MAHARRLPNKVRPKVPYRVWVASWGHRDSDPSNFVVLSGDLPKRKAIKLLTQLVEEWIDNEEQYLEQDREVDAVVYGPFLESYIKTVKDLPPNDRADLQRDLVMGGYAYLP